MEQDRQAARAAGRDPDEDGGAGGNDAESLVQTMEPWEKETLLGRHPGWFDAYLSQVSQ